MKPYYVKNIYTLGEKIKQEGEKFKINYNFDFDFKNIKWAKSGLTLYVEYDENLEYEEYNIKISNKGIYIKKKSERGLYYALNTINSLISKEDRYVYINKGRVYDKPSFKIRGIIEGFYGEPWSFDDRIDMINFLPKNYMNSYFYAPKDDEYHRRLWRLLYPEDKFKEIKILKELCDKNNVDFYYCISPGIDFDYTKDEEFLNLYNKLLQVIEIGINKFAVLMDDIDYNLKGESLKKFKRPGIAHSYIVNSINKYLSEKLDYYSLVICPTEYYQNYDTEYRRDLKNEMDKNVMVFWTGYNTIAEYIPNDDGEKNREYFGHELILWDNYPVNDFAKHRLFMGPIANRGDELYKSHIGMVSNPMNQWQLSKISVTTMAHYMWSPQKYNPDLSFEIAIENFDFEDKKALKLFCEINRFSIIDYYILNEVEEALENKDIKELEIFFSKLKSIKKAFEDSKNKKLLKEAEPYIIAIDLEIKIWEEIKNQNKEKVLDLISQYLKYEYKTGANIALKAAKTLGFIDFDIQLDKRQNYWDEDMEG